MDKSTRIKLETIVKDYMHLFPWEVEDFKKAARVKKAAKGDNKYGLVKGSDVIERILFELPETLHAMIKARLSDEEYDEFRSREGSRWFAQKFKVFQVTDKV